MNEIQVEQLRQQAQERYDHNFKDATEAYLLNMKTITGHGEIDGLMNDQKDILNYLKKMDKAAKRAGLKVQSIPSYILNLK